jgi:hypothetical protein
MKIGSMFVFTLILLSSVFTSSIPKLSNVAAKSSTCRNPVDKLSMSGREFVVDEYTLALWHFNEGEGQVVHDESPHHNDGTLGPTSGAEDSDPSWVSGFTGVPGDYALSFNDWNDYVNIPDNPDGSLDLQLLPQFTVEFWTYLRQISRDGYHWNRFLTKAFAADPPDLCGYGVYQCQGVPEFSTWVFDYGGTNWGIGCNPPPLNEWVLVSVVYDGNHSRIYFDDVMQAETLVGNFNFTDTTAPLTIGKWPGWDVPWLDSVDGIIDEVRFSSIARDSLMFQHDITIGDLTCCKTVVGQGFNANINVSAENCGGYIETFNVTAYYGNGTLTPEQWNVFWSMGDCNRDGYINLADAEIVAANLNWHGPPGENPADINSDGTVDILDAIMLANHFGREIWMQFMSVVGTQSIVNLAGEDFATLKFTWNTTGLAYGNYTLVASAKPVTNETDTADNHLESWATVTIPGDVDGNSRVDMTDVMLLLAGFGSTMGPDGNYWHRPPCAWCPHSPNLDIDDNSQIDMGDVMIALGNFGRYYPYP